jgi:hypothetical protein
VLLACCILMRTALLVLDAEPRFFLGDSESYLATRLHGWMPPDRSWLYGLATSAMLEATHRLGSLILLQGLLSAIVIALLGWTLLRAGLAFWVVAVLAAAVSLEPLWLYYDRAVLTDSPGALALCAGLSLAVLALRDDSVGAAIVAGGLLGLAVSLRTALLPPVVWAVAIGLIVALKAPGRHLAPGTPVAASRRAALALALAALAGLLAWAQANKHVAGHRAAVNPNSGFFLLGAVAPILHPEDFSDTGVDDPRALLDATHHQQREMRNAQLYGPNEIADRLRRSLGKERLASDAAGAAARAAMWRDPLGFAHLVRVQASEYLASTLYRQNFAYWAGLDRPLPQSLVADLRERVRDAPAAEQVSVPSPALDHLERCLAYLPTLAWAALIVPLLLVARLPFATPIDRPGLALIAGATLAYLAGIFAFSAEMVPRYLLPLVPLVALGVGLLASSRRSARGPASRRI